MTAAPVATGYTLAFITAHLPEDAGRILEIGCGNGELAARLLANGFKVVGLDSNEACVETARAAGVDVSLGAWPAEVDDRFDAVLFTRSLHHIAPLDKAVAAAVAALKPEGRIIVEDFRVEADSVRTDAWYQGLIQSLDAKGQLRDENSAERLLEKLDFGEHRHELHSSLAMAEALSGHGGLRQEDAAYYFRYLESELREAHVANSILDHELVAIAAGEIDALGKRFVLTPRD